MIALARNPRRNQIPQVGDKVTPIGRSAFTADLMGLVGEVTEVLRGARGPILAVRFAERPEQTFDIFWKKLRRVQHSR